MIKIPERLYLVKDIISRDWNGKTFHDIILRARDMYNDKEFDTILPAQLSYKSTAAIPKAGNIIKCELDVMSREIKGRYIVMFGIYKYSVERQNKNPEEDNAAPDNMPADIKF